MYSIDTAASIFYCRCVTFVFVCVSAFFVSRFSYNVKYKFVVQFVPLLNFVVGGA